MLSLATLTKWMRGIIEDQNAYGLPDSVYNDVVPSGIHHAMRSEF